MPSAVSDLKTRMLELSAPDTDGVLRGVFSSSYPAMSLVKCCARLNR